jgi:enoyl-[acyl-carrier-protein] reductase (NADH)
LIALPRTHRITGAAHATAFLAAQGTTGVTGALLAVDGGVTL